MPQHGFVTIALSMSKSKESQNGLLGRVLGLENHQ
jgi:hypothetical protein